MKEFWSNRICSLTPYTPGEQPKDRKFIKLNTNENPYPPSPRAMEAISSALNEGLRLYPDPDGTDLCKALSRVYGVDMDSVFVGNGSDEVLAMAFQAFFIEVTEIVIPDITFSFYPGYANLLHIRCKTIALEDDFTVPVHAFCGGNDGVVIANPNAPTGMELGTEAIEEILQANADVVVIVDEAYVDFGGESVLPLIARYPNLLVVQTCSKSRALAGARVGFAFGNPNLIAALNCVKNSFNSYTLDRLALVGATAAVEDTDYFDAQCSRVIQTRERTARALRALGFVVCPSKTNFLFISHPSASAQTLFAALRARGILVRWFNLPRISNYLRVTIGTDEDMDAFLAAMADLTGEG